MTDNPTTSTANPSTRIWDIPAGVWALGFVSLLMDVSSEMIHALLPVYLVSVLGTSMATVGVIEGVAEANGLDHQNLFRRDLRLAGQAQVCWP